MCIRDRLGIVLASLLMSALYLGGESAQLELQLPASVSGLFQGALLFFLLAAELLIHFRVRAVRRSGAGHAAVAAVSATPSRVSE